MASTKARHILDLSPEEKQTFLDSFDYIFSDIDGVVWIIDHIIDGVGKGFEELEKIGKKVTFVTNNSVRSLDSYEKLFKSVGLNIKKEEIWHPALSTVQYLKSINFDGLIYVIATESFKNVLKEAGFKYIDGPNKVFEESFHELAKHVFDKEPVRAVVIDVDFNLSAVKLIRAQLYLKHPECILVAGATDNMLPVMKNASIIGPGPFADILEKASGKPMIKVGKPGKELADMLLNHFHVNDRKRTLMIGDMLEQDVGFAKHCGLQSLLVLSGGCTLDELNAQTNPDLIPDYYADGVADFVKFMTDLKK